MTTYRYSTQTDPQKTAKAVGLNLAVSTKQGIEICNALRRKKIADAKRILNQAIQMDRAIPFRRFNKDMGHKPGGIGPGRYPVSACTAILSLLEACEANAQHKNLDTKSLVLVHISCQKGPKQWHYGRKRRRMMKRTHLEIVLEEFKTEKKADQKKQEQKIQEKKTHEKNETGKKQKAKVNE